MELRTNHAVRRDLQDPREGSRLFRAGEPGKIGWAPLCQSDGVTLEAIPAGVTRSFPAWPRMRANETAHGLSSTGIPDRQVTIRFRRRPYHPGYRPIRTCGRLDRRREIRLSSNRVPRLCWSGPSVRFNTIGAARPSWCSTSSRSSRQLCQTPRVHDIESIVRDRNARAVSYFDAGPKPSTAAPRREKCNDAEITMSGCCF